MRIFIGSSQEKVKNELRYLASWIEAGGHEAVPWDTPGLFPLGGFILPSLFEIAEVVDAAAFVFAEDDEVWYRVDSKKQTRDNVLVEYGLFAGMLGLQRSIICKFGQTRTPTDLSGLQVVDVSKGEARARLAIVKWLEKLQEEHREPNTAPAAVRKGVSSSLGPIEEEALNAVYAALTLAAKRGEDINPTNLVLELSSRFNFNLVVASLYLLKARGVINWTGVVLRPKSRIQL